MAQKQKLEKARDEFAEMLSRFGWQWAILASTAGMLIRSGCRLHPSFLDLLTQTRAKIESGCYSICQLSCDLHELEAQLFPIVVKASEYEAHRLLDLMSKAIRREITESVIDLSGLQPILADCSLPCTCRK